METAEGVSQLPAPREATHGPWLARLSLDIEVRGPRSVLVSSSHVGPLRVQRPFYPEPTGACHIYVLHPPAGVASGDELQIQVRVGERARALITTPGAGKLYKSRGPQALVRNELSVQRGGCLEWFPQENIVFDGAHARLVTQVELESEARYAGWDIVCLGRPKSDERFQRGRLSTQLTVRRAGQLRFMERGLYQGGDELLQAAWGLSGQPVFGLFMIAHDRADEAWVELVREALGADKANLAVTCLPGLLLARYIGPSTFEARGLFELMYSVLRPLYAETPSVVPRIWRT